MKMFEVTCTKVYNGTMIVNAETYEEAMEYAATHLDDADFEYGETTADYADEIDEEDYDQFEAVNE